MRSVDRDPLLVPRSPEGLPTVPADARRPWSRRATEVGAAAGRPPRLLGDWARHRCRRRRRWIEGRVGRERRIEAVDGLLEPSLAAKGTGEAGEVAAGRPGPCKRIAEAVLDVDQQPRERADVLVVVAHHCGQGLGGAAAQEPEIATGDLPAVDIVVPDDAEQHPLDGPEAGVVHPVTEQPAHDRQQVEVAVVCRGGPAGEPVSGDQQRPVEPAAVVGHEPGSRAGCAGRSRRAAPPLRPGRAGAAGPAGTGRPPTSPGRPGTRRSRPRSRAPWSRCRGRRAVGPLVAGRAGPRAGDGRAACRPRRARPGRARRRPCRPPRHRRRRPGARRAPGSGWGGRAGGRRGSPDPGWPPGTERADGRAGCPARRAGRSSSGGEWYAGAQLREEPQRQPTGIDVRLEPRSGARRAAGVAVARGDELRRAGKQLVVALPQALG